MTRIDPWDARAILTVCGCACADDFHALSTDKVERLLAHADARKYRKPANAIRLPTVWRLLMLSWPTPSTNGASATTGARRP